MWTIERVEPGVVAIFPTEIPVYLPALRYLSGVKETVAPVIIHPGI
jgi:hypothetical protein